MTAHELLVALTGVVQSQLQAARDSDVEQVIALDAERDRLFGQLPDRLPEDCLPQAQVLQDLTAAVTAELARIQSAQRQQIDQFRKVRARHEAYAPPARSGGYSAEA